MWFRISSGVLNLDTRSVDLLGALGRAHTDEPEMRNEATMWFRINKSPFEILGEAKLSEKTEIEPRNLTSY